MRSSLKVIAALAVIFCACDGDEARDVSQPPASRSVRERDTDGPVHFAAFANTGGTGDMETLGRLIDAVSDAEVDFSDDVADSDKAVEPGHVQGEEEDLAASVDGNKAGKSLTEIRGQLEMLKKEIDREYNALVKEKEQLAKEAEALKGREEILKHNKKVEILNKKAAAYVEKGKIYEARVDAYNERVRQQNDKVRKRSETP